MNQDYKNYVYGAQSILKALQRNIQDKSKEEILEIINELIESFEDDLDEIKDDLDE